MIVGDQKDIYNRIIQNLPVGWFGNVSHEDTPNLYALLAAFVNTYYFHYNSQYLYALLQQRIQTATGANLDLIAQDYMGIYLPRLQSENDDSYRKRILACVVQEKATRRGMYNALLTLTGFPPIIWEPWSAIDCMCLGDGSDPLNNPIVTGGLSYIDNMGVQHTYGNECLGSGSSDPYTFYIVVFLPANQGMAAFPGLNLDGVISPNPYFGLNYNWYAGSQSLVTAIITREMVLQVIELTKTLGTKLVNLTINYINAERS